MKNLLAAKDASFTFERARLEELESKVARLEELELKMTRLEDTVQKQEKMIISLQPKETPIGSGKFIPSHLALNDQPKIGKSASFPRTCRELRSYDPSLNSGMHWIDPDGQGVGDDPIYVYCDMAKGTEFSSLSNRYRIIIKNVILLYRFHFYPTRQWIADGRRPLRRSRLLLASCSLQQCNDEANERTDWFIKRMSPVHQSKKQLIVWLFLTQSIVIYFSFHS